MLAGFRRPHTAIGRIMEPVLVVDAFDEEPSMPPAATISPANVDGGHPKLHSFKHTTRVSNTTVPAPKLQSQVGWVASSLLLEQTSECGKRTGCARVGLLLRACVLGHRVCNGCTGVTLADKPYATELPHTASMLCATLPLKPHATQHQLTAPLL